MRDAVEARSLASSAMPRSLRDGYGDESVEVCEAAEVLRLNFGNVIVRSVGRRSRTLRGEFKDEFVELCVMVEEVLSLDEVRWWSGLKSIVGSASQL